MICIINVFNLNCKMKLRICLHSKLNVSKLNIFGRRFYVFILLNICITITLILLYGPRCAHISEESELLFHLYATQEWFPNGIRGDNVKGYPYMIVPNIIHYIVLGDHRISFVHFISIKSVLRHHKPEHIMFHCDCDDLYGDYWERVKTDASNIKLTVRRITVPNTVFGRRFSFIDHLWHASDVIRNRVLMEYGGIYLDRDVYIVKSLDPLRKYEMTLDFELYSHCLGTQLQIAHKNARFLKLYLQTYRDYDPYRWYWNAGEYPTLKIIDKYPHLVHRMNHSFGVTGEVVCPILYQQNSMSWQRDYYAFHLLMRGNSVAHYKWCFKKNIYGQIYFDEENVKTSNVTFGQMSRLVLYNTTNVIH